MILGKFCFVFTRFVYLEICRFFVVHITVAVSPAAAVVAVVVVAAAVAAAAVAALRVDVIRV